MKRFKTWAPIVIFIIGASIFLYPFVANQVVMYFQKKTIKVYETQVDSIKLEQIHEMFLEAEHYNDNLAGDPLHDPFIINSGYALPDNYLDVLNLTEEGVMCYLEIPTIGVNMPVYHGTSDEVLQVGVGHIEGTSLPIGGYNRHSILCAHRGLPSAELFSRLNEVELDDYFYINVLNEIHVYQVKQIEIIKPEEINAYMKLDKNKDIITLMTCTPYAVNTHRILVRGERIEDTAIVEEKHNNKKNVNFYYMFCVICMLVFMVIVIIQVNKKMRTYR